MPKSLTKKLDKAIEKVASATDLLLAHSLSTGFEEVTPDDFMVPFVSVVQKMSAEVEEGVKPGSLINRATQQVYESVTVVPVYFKKRFVLWTPRDLGGGFKGEFLPGDKLVKEAVYDKDANKLKVGTDELTETAYFYCLNIVEDGPPEPVVFSMTSSMLKSSRQWLTIAQAKKIKNGDEWVPAPFYANSYRVEVSQQTNTKGSWYGLKVSLNEPVEDVHLIKAAIDFYKLVSGGSVDVDRKVEQGSPDSTKEQF